MTRLKHRDALGNWVPVGSPGLPGEDGPPGPAGRPRVHVDTIWHDGPYEGRSFPFNAPFDCTALMVVSASFYSTVGTFMTEYIPHIDGAGVYYLDMVFNIPNVHFTVCTSFVYPLTAGTHTITYLPGANGPASDYMDRAHWMFTMTEAA